MQNNILRILGIVVLILLIPFFGNIFVEGWNWGILDFIAMGLLLFVTGLAIDWAIRKFSNPLHRIIAVVVIVATLLLVWVELAVEAISQLI